MAWSSAREPRSGPPRPTGRLSATVAEAFSGDGARARALRGSAWTIAEFGLSNAIRLGSNLILTRLLAPDVFGMMAIVVAVLIGLEMMSDIGLGASVVRSRRAEERRFLDTIWTVQIVRGIALWLGLCLAAQPVAAFYEEPLLAQILPVMGFGVVVNGFAPTRLHLAQRRMALGRVSAIGIGSQLVSLATMIGLALVAPSPWALVAGSLVAALVRTGALHFLLPGPRDRIGWDRSAWREIIGFGGWITLGTIFTFVVNQSDRLVFGRYIEFDQLGVYTIGFFFANFVLMFAMNFDKKILFPIFSEKNLEESINNFYNFRKSRLYLISFMIAINTFLMMIAPYLIDILYDDRYIAAQIVLMGVLFAQIPTLVFGPYSAAFLARGASRENMSVIGVRAVAQIALMIGALEFVGFGAALLAPGLACLVSVPLVRRVAKAHGVWDPLLDAGLLAAGFGLGAAAFATHWDALVLLEAFETR